MLTTLAQSTPINCFLPRHPTLLLLYVAIAAGRVDKKTLTQLLQKKKKRILNETTFPLPPKSCQPFFLEVIIYQMQKIRWKPTPLGLLLAIIGSFFIVAFQLKKPVLQKMYLDRFKLSVQCTGTFDRNDIDYEFHKMTWQNLTAPNKRTIFMYGAYYDDRAMHKGKQFVQVLAVGAFTTKKVYAIVWAGKSKQSEIITSCFATKHGTGHKIDGLYYDQFYFSCEINNLTTIPTFVSLTYDDCSLQANLLSVHIPERSREHKFSVCVETSYGHVDPYQIIEWVEANMLMGVTMFNVYPCNMSSSNLELFRQLESDGIMQVTMTPSPLPETTWANQMLSSPASFNDCMMRQMYSTEYIIPLDFDEIISPRSKANDYSGLIKEVDKAHKRKKPFPTYTFRMGLFFTTCDTNVTGDLNIVRYVKRTNFYGNVKSIVNPRMCLSVFNHYCKVNFKALKEPKRVNVKPEIGLVNHYRRSWSNRYCKLLNKDGIIDVTFRDRFSGQIYKQFKKRVDRYRKLRIL